MRILAKIAIGLALVGCEGRGRSGSVSPPTIVLTQAPTATEIASVPSVHAPEPAPHVTVPSSPVVQFDLGHYAACAVRADGRVVCWGGMAGSLPTDAASAPRFVQGLDDAVQVSGDDGGFCAVRRGGDVSCWEQDGVAKPVALHDVVELGSGCARHRDGHVSQWVSQSPEPVPVAGITDARALGSGAGSPCVITQKGIALCWGSNQWHQLGDGTTRDRDTPAPPKGLTHVDEIGTSRWFADCARIGGELRCWGGEGATVTTPTAFSAIRDAAHIAIGEYHSCVLRRNGMIACWGFNGTGQLGVPPAQTPTGESLTPIDVPGIHDVVELEVGGGEPAAGGGSTCVRTKEGAILCWGALPDSPTPVKVSLDVK